MFDVGHTGALFRIGHGLRSLSIDLVVPFARKSLLIQRATESSRPKEVGVEINLPWAT